MSVIGHRGLVYTKTTSVIGAYVVQYMGHVSNGRTEIGPFT